MLINNIYYADQRILELILTDFDLRGEQNWYELYQNKKDESYSRQLEWFWRHRATDGIESFSYMELA